MSHSLIMSHHNDHRNLLLGGEASLQGYALTQYSVKVLEISISTTDACLMAPILRRHEVKVRAIRLLEWLLRPLVNTYACAKVQLCFECNCIPSKRTTNQPVRLLNE